LRTGSFRVQQTVLSGARTVPVAFGLQSKRDYSLKRLILTRYWQQDVVEHPNPIWNKYADLSPTKAVFESRVQRAPVLLASKAGLIATGLFEDASVLGVLPQVRQELLDLCALFLKDPALDEFVRDKTKRKAHRHKVFGIILHDCSRLLQKLVAMMIEDGELHLLPKMALDYEMLMKHHCQEMNIVLTFAKLPDMRYIGQMKGRVLAKLPSSVSPKWKIRIDPRIVGGMIVDAGQYYKLNESIVADRNAFRNRVAGYAQKKLEEREALAVAAGIITPHTPTFEQVQQLRTQLWTTLMSPMTTPEYEYHGIKFVEWL